ncbi:unnamed protein product [Mycetohabitans rhizoxinica HKI 454]|uniref:Uncharacterized protein n=1 Tax=Mycetohabitans rhizoxinica (strain DSM 19002 / CIP 109453 / HKI 454) TaxID=882378 RepID=E5AM62_MYCRK|nr:unnamed protein product [Mycetohabitans rhizoxinica HKI 454]
MLRWTAAWRLPEPSNPYGPYRADCVSPVRRAALQARTASGHSRALRSLWRGVVSWPVRAAGPSERDDACRVDHVRDCAGRADRSVGDQRDRHADYAGRRHCRAVG